MSIGRPDSPLRILVTGAAGMLGHALLIAARLDRSVCAIGAARRPAHLARLRDLGFDALRCDISNDHDIHQTLSVGFDVIVNCAGVTKKLAVDVDETMKVNAEAPHRLAAIGKQYGARLIQISTDCVFSGRHGHYSETDVPDPLDLYDRSKLLGEVTSDGHLTIRTSFIGRELDTQNGLLEWFLAQRGAVSGYAAVHWSGLTTPVLSRALLGLCHRPDVTGLLNVSAERIDKYSLLHLLARAFGRDDIEIRPVMTPAFDRSLNDARFRALGFRCPPHVDMISECVSPPSHDDNESGVGAVGVMTSMTPKVTAVVPTYQRAVSLRRTLDQLTAQTLANIEIIVADDGSSDETADVVRGYGDSRVKYIRRPHLGMPRILNEGISIAQGDYIMTCHDHDLYEPSLLEALSGVLERHPSAAFAHCGIIGVDSTGVRELERFVRNYDELTPGRRFLVEQMLPGLHSPVPALSMVRRTAVAERALDPAFEGCADVELWLRLSAQADVGYVTEPLIRVLARDGSSQFHSATCRLAALVFDAKSRYLAFVEDAHQRERILRGWRSEVDHTALLQLLNPDRSQLEAIVRFADRYGTPHGAKAVALLAKLPHTVSGAAIKSVRAAWRRTGGPSRRPGMASTRTQPSHP